ncbi:MAG: hypothetical protein COW39_05945 [Comamonadaceae bacterium CG17_big_fil_post_rev_8_21_14_2_50_60_13]|nr:MAG: hypothetical protein COW39_05945 [Comamonadaceae bacterium CG17_big_fil_post_rev_8_21_14_2_50_60_13]
MQTALVQTGLVILPTFGAAVVTVQHLDTNDAGLVLAIRQLSLWTATQKTPLSFLSGVLKF